MKNPFILCCMMFSTYTYASDIFWVKMDINHSYKDLATHCASIKPGDSFFMAAQHEEGKLLKVVLNNFSNEEAFTAIHKSLELSPEEVKQIELYQDPKGRYWFKKIPLRGYVLRWILYWATESSFFCRLPQPLWSISPVPANYEFEMEGIKDGILISYSQKLAFTGQRSDGEAFDATLQLVQREFKGANFR